MTLCNVNTILSYCTYCFEHSHGTCFSVINILENFIDNFSLQYWYKIINQYIFKIVHYVILLKLNNSFQYKGKTMYQISMCVRVWL